ncbi:efflux RND transporter permease subunit [Parageobacillus thermoglucosidasius]|uniref:Efflux RND transporter permease subunit n=1 Tax=Parageobacillus thermoglucosidasius TaxID=1426 RepID=A0AB38QZX6_PARTM|nr:efflux RND transporter permease subunit [Parageobacillus thermoglucosidasius]UOE76650.1 efflux RND transporter permease subunit [Parageobacillus thermoglucosidasius]
MIWIKKGIQQPVVTLLLFIALSLAGVFSYFEMDKQEDPEFLVNGVAIVTAYPGAGSEKVEQLVTNVLEKKIKTVSEVQNIESFSLPNASALFVTFKEGNNLEKAQQKVKEQVDQAKKLLPEEATEPEIKTDLSEMAFMIVHLSQDGQINHEELKEKANDLQKRFDRVTGVKRTEILGLADQRVEINVDIPKLKSLGLSWLQVMQVLQKNHVQIPEGTLKGNEKKNVLTVGGLGNPDQIANLPVFQDPESGKQLVVKDFAKVKWGYEKESTKILTGEKQSAAIIVYVDYHVDARKTGEELRKAYQSWQKELPKQYTGKVVFDQSESVNKKFHELYRELGVGILVVIVICLLGLAVRSALITSLSVPVTVCISLFFLNLWGVSLHQISIASIILVLGILVDDSIVSNENIERHVTENGNNIGNIIKAVYEVTPSIIVATLTIVAGFAPLYFLEGDTGRFIHSIPQVIIVTLLVSLLVSLFFIPALRARFGLKGQAKESEWLLRGWSVLQSKYEQLATKTLKRAPLWIAIFFGVSTALLALLPLLQVQFFPKADGRSQLVVDIRLPQGSSLEQTERVVKKVREIVKHDKAIDFDIAYLGQLLPRIYYNEKPIDRGESVAQMMLHLNETGVKETEKVVDRLNEQLNGKFPKDTRVLVRQFEQGPPIEAPIQIRMKGENLAQLQKISEDVKRELDGIPHITQTQSSLGRKTSEVFVIPDKEKSLKYGIFPQDIALNHRFALEGIEVGKAFIENESFPVLLKANQSPRNIEELGEFWVSAVFPNGQSQYVPLNQIAKISTVQTVPQITHYNGERQAVVTAYVDHNQMVPQVTKKVQERLKALEEKWPSGYQWTMEGQEEQRTQAFQSMNKFFVLSILLIFILVFIQFRSFWKLIVIMTAIYMAMSGAILSLYLTNQPLGFMALLGMIGLGGVVVRNGMMLVEFADNALDRGQGLKDALIQAGRLRLRPILLTSLSAVGGLTPLAIIGGNLFRPLAVTMIGGLLYSTALTLLAVPALYYVIARKKEKRNA